MAAPRLLTLSRLLTTNATATNLCRFTTASSTRQFSLIRTLSVTRYLSPPSFLPSSQRRLSSTRHAQNPMNDEKPKGWANRPPEESILLDGCDFEHWFVVPDPPPKNWTRDQIIDYYIKTLATVVGSEDEARMKIYSVSTKHYFAFGALVSEELSFKLRELEKVRLVLPDAYLDVKNKDYGGEPFIDGQAAPYDPKYHEEWERHNQMARGRNNWNDRSRNNDWSRNVGKQQRTQRANMGGALSQPGPPMNAGHEQNIPPNNAGYQQNMPPRNAGFQQNMPPNNAGYQPNMPPNNGGYQPNMPPNNAGYQPSDPPSNFGYQPNKPPNHARKF